MDTMLQHPGIELQVLIKEKGLTQKAFASILGKKISEVNELLKGKRNVTIQRDYLLHQALGTPIKYWIMKQIDYEYSLLDVEELENKTNLSENINDYITENKDVASDGDKNNFKEEKNVEINNSTTHAKNIQNDNKVDNENGQENKDENFKERAQIFKSF